MKERKINSGNVLFLFCFSSLASCEALKKFFHTSLSNIWHKKLKIQDGNFSSGKKKFKEKIEILLQESQYCLCILQIKQGCFNLPPHM